MIKKYALTFLSLLFISLSALAQDGNPVDSTNPEIDIEFTFGSQSICKGQLVLINLDFPLRGDSEILNISWYKRVNNLRTFVQSGSVDDSNFLTINDLEETTTFLISVNVRDQILKTEITIEVSEVNPGVGTELVFCKSDDLVDLFAYLSESPDETGDWISPDGNLFSNTNTANFDPTIDVEGTYVYEVINDVCGSATSEVTIYFDKSPNCKTKSLTDLDGDGVANDQDLDDDNDGILDSVENSICKEEDLIASRFLIHKTFGKGDPRTDSNVVNDLEFTSGIPQDLYSNKGEYSVAASTHLLNFNNEHAIYVATDLIGNVDASGDIDGRYLAINMKSDEFLNKPIYQIDNLVFEKDVIYELSLAIVNLGNNESELPVHLLIEIVDASTNDILFSQNTNEIIGGNDLWGDFGGEINFNRTITNASFRIINLQGVVNYNGNDLGIDNIFLSTKECNIDKDELPNFLDLDSDNDGIFDTIEAGLDPSLDADNNGIVDGGVDPETGIPLAVLQGLSPVDQNGNGIPDYLEKEEGTLGVQVAINSKEFLLYPNPASEIVNIGLKTIHLQEKFVIIDINGTIVKRGTLSQKEVKIDVTTLQSGIYFMSINNGKSISKAQKLIIE